MRLWTLHPQYLDTKGLLALWRESLLAQKVLDCRTKGYRNHPQLERFKEHPDPLGAIGFYLYEVWKEADSRGYHFDAGKILKICKKIKPVRVFKGQVDFELKHLVSKLQKRDQKRCECMKKIKKFRLHRLFKVVSGGREAWERHE